MAPQHQQQQQQQNQRTADFAATNGFATWAKGHAAFSGKGGGKGGKDGAQTKQRGGGKLGFQPAPQLNMVNAWRSWQCPAARPDGSPCGWTNKGVSKVCERHACEQLQPGIRFQTLATNQLPAPDAPPLLPPPHTSLLPPPGSVLGVYANIGGKQVWLEGNRAQRKRHRRTLEREAADASTADTSQDADASATDPANTTAIAELQAAIKCSKALGADVALLEARLLELRPPATATPKQLTYGQAKYEAKTLEKKHHDQVNAVVLAQQALQAQTSKLDELALDLAKARQLRDELGQLELAECNKVKAEALAPMRSQLHVAQILQGEKSHRLRPALRA